MRRWLRRLRTIVPGLVVGAGLLWGGYVLLIAPQEKRLDRHRRQLSSVEQKINEGWAAEAQLPQWREETRSKEQELSRWVWHSRTTPEAFDRVSAAAFGAGFEVVRLTPRQVVRRPFFEERPLAVTLRGPAALLPPLIDELLASEFPTAVDGLVLRRLPGGPGVQVDFTFTAFVGHEEAG